MKKIKKKIQKIISFAKRLLRGDDVLSVPSPKEKWEQQFAKGYWDFLLNLPYNISVTAMMLQKQAEQIERPLKILDVGCGNGALARSLAGVSIEYWGTDISQTALDQARELYPEGTYICKSMDEDPSLIEKFDIIVFSEVLLYGNYRDIIRLHKPYLKEDGKILVSLYDTWRTKLIWRHIKSQLTVEESVYVKNEKKGVGWHIRLGKPNHHE